MADANFRVNWNAVYPGPINGIEPESWVGGMGLKSWRQNLLSKILFAFMVILIIPMMIIWWISRLETVDTAYSQSTNYHEEITKQLKLMFDQRIETIVSASLDLFANEDFQRIIIPTVEPKMFHNLREEYFQIERVLLNFTNKTRLKTMTIYQNRDELLPFGLYSFKFKSMHEASEQSWFQQANEANGAVVWLTADLQNRGSGDGTVLSMVRSLKDISNNKLIGYMQIDIPASYFHELINQTRIGYTGGVVLLNQLNEIIATTERNNLQQYFKQFQSFATVDWHVGKTGQIMYGEWNVENQPNFLLFQQKINDQLRLVSMIEKSEALSSVRLMDQRNMFVLLFLIILPVFLLLAIHFVFLRPLLRLSKLLFKTNNIDLLQIPYTGRNDEIGIIAGSIHNLLSRLRLLINEVYVQKIKQQEAELRMIQSQINPHLLYNTLDSINLLAFKNDMPDIQKMIRGLSQFFRISLSNGRDVITIREEIEHVKAFLMLQQYRYDYSLDVRYEIDESLLEHNTIKCVLQPLVENALFHGFNSDLSRGILIIKAYTVATNEIRLSVCDNGVGLTVDQWEDIIHEENKGHHGIWNIHTRVELVYGQNYGLKLEPQEKGTYISVCFPIEHTTNYKIG